MMKKNLLALSLSVASSLTYASAFTVETVEVESFDTNIEKGFEQQDPYAFINGGVQGGGLNGGTQSGRRTQGGSQGGFVGDGGFTGQGQIPGKPTPSIPGPSFPNDPYYGGGTSGDIGQVLSVAREIVALGEAVYNLVQKGKPSNTSNYAPISIVPRDPMTQQYVDPFDMEYCSIPVTKKFSSSIKSGVATVVKFDYEVLFTHSCSYNGAGKYIQQAMVKPVAIKTSMGWDMSAEMKFGGIMNHGSKADPVAGVILIMKYKMDSWRSSFEQNQTIHLTGNGQIKTY